MIMTYDGDLMILNMIIMLATIRIYFHIMDTIIIGFLLIYLMSLEPKIHS